MRLYHDDGKTSRAPIKKIVEAGGKLEGIFACPPRLAALAFGGLAN